MRSISSLILASFVVSLWAAPAAAEKRAAFIAGTDKYDHLSGDKQLQRAVNDARAVGAAFRALGYEVTLGENLTRAQFNAQFQKFLERLQKGDTAAFYYAGHGVEIEGLNFLLPRDMPNIQFGRQEQIKRESVSVAELLLDLRSREPGIALIILDACRDNPLIPDEVRSTGGGRQGLAALRSEPPKGTFIMYSAGAGETALDRLPGNDPDRVNSIFTRKLVPLLGTKGLALHDMARQLRAEVIEMASAVQHTQRPAYYDGVIGRYCPAGCDSAPSETSGTSGPSEAAQAWEAVKDSNSIPMLTALIARYKDTFYADLARARLEELKKRQREPLPPGWDQLNARLYSTVVSLRSVDRDTIKGAGVVISAQGLIATSIDVAQDEKMLRARFDKDNSFIGEVVATDARLGIAIVRLEGGKQLPFVRFSQKSVAEGDTVLVMGGDTLSRDTRTARVRTAGAGSIEISMDDAMLGSAAFDSDGEVIGIITGTQSDKASAVHGKLAAEVVRQLRLIESLDGPTNVAELGIALSDARQPRDEGVLVAAVEEKTDAHTKGLKSGDVILEVSGVSIATPDQLVKAVANAKSLGRRAVLVRVNSGGNSRMVSVTLR